MAFFTASLHPSYLENYLFLYLMLHFERIVLITCEIEASSRYHIIMEKSKSSFSGQNCFLSETYMRWGWCFETANLKSFWVLFCTNGWVYFFPLKSKKFQGTNLQLWVGMIYFIEI